MATSGSAARSSAATPAASKRGASISRHSFAQAPSSSRSGAPSPGRASVRNSWNTFSIRSSVCRIRPANSAMRSARASAPRPDSFSSIWASSRRLDIGLRKSCTMPFASMPENARCSSRRRARSRRSSRRATPATSARHAAKQPPIVAKLSRYIDSISRAVGHSSRSTARRRMPSSSDNGSARGFVIDTENVTTGICPSPADSRCRPRTTGPPK